MISFYNSKFILSLFNRSRFGNTIHGLVEFMMLGWQMIDPNGVTLSSETKDIVDATFMYSVIMNYKTCLMCNFCNKLFKYFKVGQHFAVCLFLLYF